MREAERLFWKETVRKKEVVEGIGECTVSARASTTFSSVLGFDLIFCSCSHLYRSAAVTKYHNLGYLKQQKCIASQYWRLEVQNQGVGRAVLLPKSDGESGPASRLLLMGCRLSLAILA